MDKNEIRDDEFRIIGPEPRQQTPVRDGRRRGRMFVFIVVSVVVAAVAVAIFGAVDRSVKDVEDPNDGLFENIKVEAKPFASSSNEAYTELRDTLVGGMSLRLYIPHNATAELCLGIPEKDEDVIFAAQAADIRRDNRKILGAFVLKGQPLAWGLSKKGFCAVIGGAITVGYSENSPLFDEAIAKGGYFFRQFALVDNGHAVTNEMTNSTQRRALCTRAGQCLVVISQDDETMNDFAQALVDLGVDNAIYLVGGHSSLGWYVNADGQKNSFATDVRRAIYKNESYILWRK
jgi:hypothetical protein